MYRNQKVNAINKARTAEEKLMKLLSYLEDLDTKSVAQLIMDVSNAYEIIRKVTKELNTITAKENT